MTDPRSRYPHPPLHRRILAAIATPSAPAFADRPPTFGDAEQARVLAAMNDTHPYCDRCFAVLTQGSVADVGRYCRDLDCHGIYVPGAGMTEAWLQYAEMETEGR